MTGRIHQVGPSCFVVVIDVQVTINGDPVVMPAYLKTGESRIRIFKTRDAAGNALRTFEEGKNDGSQ